jgi:uncharacterized protein YdeI (YjbR/CyaY-like superfamily)
MNPKADSFFSSAKKWQKEMLALRTLVLECGLNEELKWGVPCYTFQKSNILLIHGFKEYVALAFFNGALLSDVNGILIQQTENVQAGRQIRFKTIKEIVQLEPVLKAYIYEAIEVEKSGLKVEYKKASEFVVAEEFKNKLDKFPDLKTAFYALTPGRQKGYYLHFSEPKQSKTRESRIENCIPKILKGKGLNDCTCGLSKRMPNCDGSHKQLQ